MSTRLHGVTSQKTAILRLRKMLTGIRKYFHVHVGASGPKVADPWSKPFGICGETSECEQF
jgi:hypothetical protein